MIRTIVIAIVAAGIALLTGTAIKDKQPRVSKGTPVTQDCTYTQGYWQNHSGAWQGDGVVTVEISQDDGIYSALEPSDWMKILNLPTGGKPYMILAHQYIAAKLNIAQGATAPQEVLDAIAGAEAYFADPDSGTYSREEILDWAETLDQFNNGIIGPGHCDDEEGGGR